MTCNFCRPLQHGCLERYSGTYSRQATVVRCDVPSVPKSLLEAHNGCGPQNGHDIEVAGGDDIVRRGLAIIWRACITTPPPVNKNGLLKKFHGDDKQP